MTERLADISAHITGIRQLGAVVNAMRGIAAARAQQARNQIASIDKYAATVQDAIGQVVQSVSSEEPDDSLRPVRPALVLFCAEQGFAGAFSERVLDAVGDDLGRTELFLIGTRGGSIAEGRGVEPRWKSAMPSHSTGIPKLAERICEALYSPIAEGEIGQLYVVFSDWQPGHGITVRRRRLFPLDASAFPRRSNAPPPFFTLPPAVLLAELTVDFIHAQLCNAALYAFAAENEARMEAMALARNHIDGQLTSLQARQRIVRQEEITSEILELAAGEMASRNR